MQFTTIALLLSSIAAVLATPIPQSAGVGESHGVGQGVPRFAARDATTGPANAKQAPDLIHDVTHAIEGLLHKRAHTVVGKRVWHVVVGDGAGPIERSLKPGPL